MQYLRTTCEYVCFTQTNSVFIACFTQRNHLLDRKSSTDSNNKTKMFFSNGAKQLFKASQKAPSEVFLQSERSHRMKEVFDRLKYKAPMILVFFFLSYKRIQDLIQTFFVVGRNVIRISRQFGFSINSG